MGKKRKLTEALRREQESQAVKRLREARVQSLTENNSKSIKTLCTASRRRWLPFDASDTVLLVGEGNFSFANCLSSQHIPPAASRMYATSFDTLEVAQKKYPDLDDNLSQLRDNGVHVLFDVDAGALEKCKALKGKLFTKIVFNFPHAGMGEKDQARNIALNQTLILRFLRSAAAFLDPHPSAPEESEQDKDVDQEAFSDLDPEKYQSSPANVTKKESSVLITLKDCKPYSLWNLPSLAKKGPLFAESLLPKSVNASAFQPIYKIHRSGEFDFDLYPGYAHRRTIGFEQGISFARNEDMKYAAKDRKDARGAVNSSRMWQLVLDQDRNG